MGTITGQTLLLSAISITLLHFTKYVTCEPILVIDTPELYNQFTNDQIGAGYHTVHILPGAHPNILSLPKLFSRHESVSTFRFVDENANMVLLDTDTNHTEAYLRKGDNLLLGLPIDYEIYEIHVRSEAKLSNEDYNYIFKWERMFDFKLFDEANVAYELSQRLDAMKALKSLVLLKLKLQLHSYNDVIVGEFLKKLTTIYLLEFDIEDLTKKQAENYREIQPTPPRWRSRLFYDLGWLSYERY